MTMRALHLCLLPALLCPASASQAALNGQQPLLAPQNEYRLNFSASAPLTFHSTFSLLQQWPNTFYPNGHTVTPCTIPRHTNLYHAHNNESFPASPEWLAFDASMAYTILGGLSDSHLLTFRTTQQVKCLYFDGESASLKHPGTLDSQMLVIHNNSAHVPEDPRFGQPPHPPNDNGTHPPGHDHRRPPPGFNPLKAEYERAEGLCNFIKDKSLGGLGWGYEGIVRMNAAFELIWCNFSSPSTELVSWLNVSAPYIDGIPGPWDEEMPMRNDTPSKPPRRGGPGIGWLDQPFRGRSAYEWFLSATKTFGFYGGQPGRGEARVRIDSCSLFTFYDDALRDQSHVRVESQRDSLNLTADGLWQSPVIAKDREIGLQKLTHRRRAQRAMNVSAVDGQYMRTELEHRMRNGLAPDTNSCTNIDWVLTTQTIVADYSSDIYELKSLLNEIPSFGNATIIRQWLASSRGLAHHLYMPYYQYPQSVRDDLSGNLSPSNPLSLEALNRCKSQHAVAFKSESLSRSESTTYNAIIEVLSGICTMLLPIFLSIELLWLTNFNNATQMPDLDLFLQGQVTSVTTNNLHNLEELMAWLGWGEQWTTCSPGCELGQVCGIPIFPVMGIGHFAGPDGQGRWGKDDHDWLEPKCVDAAHLL